MGPPNRSPCSVNQSESFEQEINVFLKVAKTVAFHVKKSETVKNLKAMFCKKDGVSESEIFFNGERLKDDDRLMDCGIQKDSSLDLVLLNSRKIKLFIFIPSIFKTSELDAKVNDTVQQIKFLINKSQGIHTDRCTLLHAGVALEEFRTLDSLRIKGGTTLQLIFEPKDNVRISVKLVTGEIIKIDVKLLYTVYVVKAIIGSVAGVAVNDQNLVYMGMKLENLKTLAFYRVVEESTLEMVYADTQIFVKHHNGKATMVDVCQRNTVANAKEKMMPRLEAWVDSVFDDFMFDDEELDEDLDLISYGIGRRSRLFVRDKPMEVCVHVPSLKRIWEFVGVYFYDNLQKIKFLLPSRVRRANDLMFHYNGILLKDEVSTFASLGIKETKVTFVATTKPKSGKILSIYVETVKEKIVQTNVSSLYTVGFVKSLVGNIAGVEVGGYTLVYEGVSLNDLQILGWCIDIQVPFVVKMGMAARSSISIFVKPWSGKTLTLYVGQYDIVRDVKAKIFCKLAIPYSTFYYLSFCGKVLEDGKTLACYGIKQDNTILMNCRCN